MLLVTKNSGRKYCFDVGRTEKLYYELFAAAAADLTGQTIEGRIQSLGEVEVSLDYAYRCFRRYLGHPNFIYAPYKPNRISRIVWYQYFPNTFQLGAIRRQVIWLRGKYVQHITASSSEPGEVKYFYDAYNQSTLENWAVPWP